MKRLLFLSFIGFLIISCKKEVVVANQEVIVKSAKNSPTADKTENLVAKIVLLKEKVLEDLEKNPKDANQLYEDFSTKNYKLISKIEDLESKILDNYYYINDRKEQLRVPDSLKAKVKLIESAQLEFWEVGEGFVEIRPVPDYFYNIFKRYVSDDYKEFLRLEAEEAKVLFSADAGIIVSLEEVSERILHWEKFMKRFPNSKKYPEALELYNDYMYAYLIGYDNTPVFNDEQTDIYPENRKEFERFMSRYPDTETTKIVAFFLEHIGKTDYEEMDELMKQEQLKYFKAK